MLVSYGYYGRSQRNAHHPPKPRFPFNYYNATDYRNHTAKQLLRISGMNYTLSLCMQIEFNTIGAQLFAN